MVINCKEISSEWDEETKLLFKSHMMYKVCPPKLVVILVGENSASKVYVRNKQKRCEKIGIISENIILPENTSEEELIYKINELNNDDTVHGILVQLPLPKHLNEDKVVNAISPNKDVDCFTNVNKGKLWTGNADIYPCTPLGIIKILDSISYNLEGSIVTIIGRSNIVGKPMAAMLLEKNASPIITHSKSYDIEKLTSISDVIICAVGKPKFLKMQHLEQENDGGFETINNPIIIDVGINRDEENKICGDVDFEKLEPLAKAITTVPGGVGLMTVSALMRNLYICYKLSFLR